MASQYRPLHLAGKGFIITGGGRGIGLSFVHAVLEAEATACVLDLLDQPHPSFMDLQSRFPNKCHYFSCDVSDQQSLDTAFGRAVATLDRVDGCVTAAGVCVDKPFEDHTWEDFERQCLINGAGTFFTVQHATRQMKLHGQGGSVVMIASQAAQHNCPGHQLSAYAGSKGLVVSLMKNLATELAPHGIRVNTISPGYIATDMNMSMAQERPSLLKYFKNAPPLKRMGVVDDLKAGLLYLLSDSSSYVTGTDLVVDGGMSVSASSI